MRLVIQCLEMLSACVIFFAALWTVAVAGARSAAPRGYLVQSVAPGAALISPVWWPR